jgi:hypothetical protein
MAEPAVLLLRYRQGLVGESRRLVHIASVPDDGAPMESLTVYCGHSFAPGEAELVGGPGGVPCLACLMRAPVPGLDDGPPAADRPRIQGPG